MHQGPPYASSGLAHSSQVDDALQEEICLKSLKYDGQECEERVDVSTGAPETPEQAQAQLREVGQLLAKIRGVHAGRASNLIALTQLTPQ